MHTDQLQEPEFPDFSVIICTRNRPGSLKSCLEACRRQQYPEAKFRLLVVDSCSTNPEETAAIAETYGARLLRELKPGLSRARNAGMRVCESDLAAFADDDAIPDPNWLAGLSQEFADPRVAAVTGFVVPEKIETPAEHLFEEMGGFVRLPRVRSEFDRQTPGWFESANFGGIGCGTNMAIRKKLLEVWPGFDERLGVGGPIPGCEDFHAYFFIIDRGYRIVYTPKAVVKHPSPSTNEDLRMRYLNGIRTTAAYICFLLATQPRYRKQVLQSIAARIAGKQRSRGSVRKLPVSLWKQLTTRISGIPLYLKSRRS